MSELSPREVEAGISRRALETLRHPRRNNRKPVHSTTSLVDIPGTLIKPEVPPAPEPGSLAEHLAAAKQNRIPSPQKTAVIDRWDRALDLLNIDGWNFRIRDTHHMHKVQVDEIALDRIELEALGRRIFEVLKVEA
jgi:hypothetical protein